MHVADYITLPLSVSDGLVHRFYLLEHQSDPESRPSVHLADLFPCRIHLIQQREYYRNYLSARGIVIYLQTTVDKQYQRTQRDKNRPLLQGAEDPRQVLEDLAKIRNPLYEEVADITLPTDEQNAKVMVNQIVDLIDNLNGLNSGL